MIRAIQKKKNNNNKKENTEQAMRSYKKSFGYFK